MLVMNPQWMPVHQTVEAFTAVRNAKITRLFESCSNPLSDISATTVVATLNGVIFWSSVVPLRIATIVVTKTFGRELQKDGHVSIAGIIIILANFHWFTFYLPIHGVIICIKKIEKYVIFQNKLF